MHGPQDSKESTLVFVGQLFRSAANSPFRAIVSRNSPLSTVSQI